jgi:hypothetical protein
MIIVWENKKQAKRIRDFIVGGFQYLQKTLTGRISKIIVFGLDLQACLPARV